MISREQAIERIFRPASSRPEQKNELAMVQACGGEHREVTYAQFEQLIADAKATIKDAGVVSGDRVVICAENSPELAACLAACWELDAISVPVDVRVTVQELANIVKMLGARVWLGSSKHNSNFKQSASEAVGDAVKVLDFKEGFKEGHSETIDFKTINFDSPAFIILTSGTTGMPKGAVHSLNSLVTNILELGEMAGIDDTMYGVLPLPLSHIFGLEVLWVAVTLGTTLVFSELTPTSFIQCVAKYKPHVVAGVPTLYGALVASGETLDLSRSKLLLSGGAPLPSSLAEEFEKKFGKRINNGYGSTESMIVALNQDGPIESVGKIVPSAKIDIVNDKDEPLAEGEVGEIRITGPMLMKKYLNHEEDTKKVLHDGHYHTGDMGFFKDGRLYISGRTKEMVIVAGYKVFPVEVEDALRKNPLVKEVAVIGQPHRQLGQIVKAVLVLNEGDLSTKLEGSPEDKKEARQQLIAQFKEYCKENLRRELRPMEWEFQPASKPLPKTGTGKVDKKKLETVAV